MKLITEQQIEELRNAFIKNLSVDFFEEDEIEAIVAEIDSFGPPVHQKILALCLALSHASSSLVPRVLDRIKTASKTLPAEELALWVSRAFDALDSRGIDAALGFLARVTEMDMAEFHAPKGLRLGAVRQVLENYLRGLSGRDLSIEPGPEIYTDTVTIFLPPALTVFEERKQNALLYKLAAANQWARIACGTLTIGHDPADTGEDVPAEEGELRDLGAFLQSLADPAFGLDLYSALESYRIDEFLRRELPGLMRSAKPVLQALFEERPALHRLDGRTAVVEALYQYCLGGTVKGHPSGLFTGLLPDLPSLAGSPSPGASLRLVARTVNAAARRKEPRGYVSTAPPLPYGRIRLDAVQRTLEEARRNRKERYREILERLAHLPDASSLRREGAENRPWAIRPLPPDREYLLIRGRLVEVDRGLRETIEDRRSVPAGVLVQGSEIGSGAVISVEELLEEVEQNVPAGEAILYDEWDYKRGGYRRNWCSLREQALLQGRPAFVEQTLRQYKGYVISLRKKFELLKHEPGILRGQKEGDDIDLDAVVQAYADMHAGLPPTEHLFTRLDRRERSIAVVFLVDMSGSTKGWVNTAEKESLVLMGEALEMLGDRYAIYGFSSMTRSRCDLFRVKGFDESYGEAVKRRIAGIEPKDYTRMGPFIRHGSKLLRGMEARTRLLITLSDGKPEDWDTYKGVYGIEDTRRALIEAREQGIHPFCITIDREAQSYLPHLYGGSSYIFIDDVRKLPSRITEIYRRLTT